jgi:ribosomal protein L29
MKQSELKNKNAADMLKLAHDKREELRVIRAGLGGSKTRNVKEIATIRKDIARVLTELNIRREEGKK